jgi:hypothetical protein
LDFSVGGSGYCPTGQGHDLLSRCTRSQPLEIQVAHSWHPSNLGQPRVEVDHSGQLLRTPAAVLDRLGRDVVPHVLVDPEMVTFSNRD